MRFWTWLGRFVGMRLGQGIKLTLFWPGRMSKTLVIDALPGSLLGRFMGWRGIAAFTWGETIVVLRWPGQTLEQFGRLVQHERMHVIQWRIYGWKFPFVYLWESFSVWCQGKNWYFDNKFEVEARNYETTARWTQ